MPCNDESDEKRVSWKVIVCLRYSTPREWRRQNSPIPNCKGDNKMNKRDFNVVGNEGTDNQELAKGIAFVSHAERKSM